MAEAFPSKYAAASQGLLSGIQAGTLISQTVRQNKQQDIENQRYDTEKAAASKQKMADMTIQALQHAYKLRAEGASEEEVNSYLVRAAEIVGNPALTQAIQITQSDEGKVYKQITDLAADGNIADALAVGRKNRVPNDMLKALMTAGETSGKILAARKTAASFLPTGTYNKVPPQTLTPPAEEPTSLFSQPMQPLGVNTRLEGRTPLTAEIPSMNLLNPMTDEERKNSNFVANAPVESLTKFIDESVKVKGEKSENITGQFITDKDITVGYSDKLGAVAYVGGKTVPYDPKIHGDKQHLKGMTQAGAANLAHQLRSEIKTNPYVKDFQDVNNKYSVMEKAMEQSTKTGNLVAVDQALITLFNKMTDPSSVVRESEYVRTPENLSLWNRFMGKIEKYGAGGAGITQADRQALIDMARKFHESYAANYDETIQSYKDLAKETGISEKLIGIPYERKITKTTTNSPVSKTPSTTPNRRATDKQGGGKVMTFDPNTGEVK